jgi:hypothetical protein
VPEPADDPVRLAGIARAIVDEADYMTLATADGSGRPWASPVWFAPVGYREFIWLSRPEARHSRNLVIRREVGIVIFDSTAPIETGQGTYVEAMGELVPDGALPRCVDVYSKRSQSRGGTPLTIAEVRAPAPHRLYRALAITLSTNGDHDERVAVDLG